jgi:hypothetical protein
MENARRAAVLLGRRLTSDQGEGRADLGIVRSLFLVGEVGRTKGRWVDDGVSHMASVGYEFPVLWRAGPGLADGKCGATGKRASAGSPAVCGHGYFAGGSPGTRHAVGPGLLSGLAPGAGQRLLDISVDRHDLVQADDLNYAGGR